MRVRGRRSLRPTQAMVATASPSATAARAGNNRMRGATFSVGISRARIWSTRDRDRFQVRHEPGPGGYVADGIGMLPYVAHDFAVRRFGRRRRRLALEHHLLPVHGDVRGTLVMD